MASRVTLPTLFFTAVVIFQSSIVNCDFAKSTTFYWGANHSSIRDHGQELQLVLDQTSGSGIQSKRTFLFGNIEMLLKMVPGNSAGTVTAYYLSSTGEAHDEIDFEFLGNVTGQPYTIHTNVYTKGHAGREQQFNLWFDPTADFHNYTIHWNPTHIVWYVDSVPIRVFRNYLEKGIPYPSRQGMRVYSSIWNADSWATRDGLEKIDWTNSPFLARLRNFKPRGCYWNGPASISQCSTPSRANWWNLPAYNQLSSAKMSQLNSVRNSYMIYDYCKDTKRFHGLLPGECFLPQF